MPSIYGAENDSVPSVDSDESGSGDQSHVSRHVETENQSSTAEIVGNSDNNQLVTSDGSLEERGTLSRASSAAVLPNLPKSQHISLLLLGVLEEKCTKAAADQLNERRGPNDRLADDHSDVRALARRLYEKMASELKDMLGLPGNFGGSESLGLREAYISGFNSVLSKAAAKELEEIETPPSDEGKIKYFAGFGPPSPQRNIRSRFASFRSVKTEPELKKIDETITATSVLAGTQPISRSGSAYQDEYEEIALLGKGGYGSVYKVKSHLDRQEYAVKKIKIPASARKNQGKGPIERVLAELHTLAKLHHPNIVRYFHGWAEHAVDINNIAPSAREEQLSNIGMLPEAEVDASITVYNSTDIFGRSESGNLVEHSRNEDSIPKVTQHLLDERPFEDNVTFEYSSTHYSEDAERINDGIRRASFTTTSSAAKTSALNLWDHDNDPDIEIIPRDLEKEIRLPLRATERSLHETPRVPLVHKASSGSGIILHIKMSLHPMTLANFLSSEPIKNPDPLIRHCFHQEIAVGLLVAVLDGVEYLHSQQIIHRDLKPANILLTITEDRAPYSNGCVNISACNSCDCLDTTKRLFVTPCISDFGLIAEMKEPAQTLNSEPGKPGPLQPSPFETPVVKPVGTLFYRPLAVPKEHPRVCPKLDVYALGVITLEMAYKFSTKSERAHVLSSLKHGILPSDFLTHPMADGILAMALEERDQRWDCPAVRHWLTSLESKGKRVT